MYTRLYHAGLLALAITVLFSYFHALHQFKIVEYIYFPVILMNLIFVHATPILSKIITWNSFLICTIIYTYIALWLWDNLDKFEDLLFSNESSKK